jgi:ribosome-associated protein
MTTDDQSPQADMIRLDHLLQLSGIAESGGQAKLIIRDGIVLVNGEVETRRRRKLIAADVVEIDGERILAKDFIS